jgi:hypothetical protein
MTPHSTEILAVLQGVLDEYTSQSTIIRIPHEGGERPFRKLLVDRFIEDLLGWPSDNVIVGERFDILCVDEQRKPVIAIETKAPGTQFTVQDFADFESRLRFHPTIEYAYITDGWTWDRVDLRAPHGKIEIAGRIGRVIQAAGADQSALFGELPETQKLVLAGAPGIDLRRDKGRDQIESFFGTLNSDRYLIESRPSRNRLPVLSSLPHSLEDLASELREIVRNLSDFYHHRLFTGFRRNQASEIIGEVTRGIFDKWCKQAYVKPFTEVRNALVQEFANSRVLHARVVEILEEFGFSKEKAMRFADRIAAGGRRLNTAELDEHLWIAYMEQVEKLMVQSAHVTVARMLLYRIGEDKQILEPRLGGTALQSKLARDSKTGEPRTPAIKTLTDMRSRMEGWLPAVFQLGEFDWWLVPDDKRAALPPEGQAWLAPIEQEYDRLLTQVLYKLDAFWFADIDVDVWRSVYQYYLPAEERQKLGGFYTPDEIIDIVLDLCGWRSECPELCRKCFMDPASGSGAFVVGALSRLQDHLSRPMPCHSEVHARGAAEWQRESAKLEIIRNVVHAVDIHPFAVFLTIVNVTFALIESFARVKQRNPNYTLDLHVFLGDSLEPPGGTEYDRDLFRYVNSRLQLTEDSDRRFQEVVDKKYDFVFGNPPWGGILKGPLAPIFDEARKQRLKMSYPDTATGKYDIYGLFMDRALQMLAPGGRFGLVTQDTFFYKDWASPAVKKVRGNGVVAARGLRRRLAEDASLVAIVNLNPFGQLFFHAMNTPAITVADNVKPDRGWFPVVTSTKPKLQPKTTTIERRGFVKRSVNIVLSELAAGKVAERQQDFAHGFRFPRQRLRDFKGARWVLSPDETLAFTGGAWPLAKDILTSFQGVTPGGEGGLKVFEMTTDEASSRHLERPLVHTAVKGLEVTRWKLPELDHVMLYPYRLDESGSRPAFHFGRTDTGSDALNFEELLDDQEREIFRRHHQSLNDECLQELLDHRIAIRRVKFPNAAHHLISEYQFLSGRKFEKKNIRLWGKEWYEYHRPRAPEAILAIPKIISPRLTREVRFALDTEGVMPQDSCIVLLPAQKTEERFRRFRLAEAKVMGKRLTDLHIMKWCLAFLNSEHAQNALTRGQQPTPKGSYAIGDDFFTRVPIPMIPDMATGQKVLSLVDELISATDPYEVTSLEVKLRSETSRILNQ